LPEVNSSEIEIVFLKRGPLGESRISPELSLHPWRGSGETQFCAIVGRGLG
jgi:hypothetical protein